jgi:uncharacterized protein
MTHTSRQAPLTRAALFGYFAISYLILLWINHGNIDFTAARQLGAGSLFFIANAYASYNALYLLPTALLTWLIGHSRLWRLLRLPHHAPRAAEAVAIAGGSLTTLFFYINAKLHTLYGMYVNGFVVNLVVTPGGLESLGGSDASNLGFALIGMGFVLGHMVLLFGIKLLLSRHEKLRSMPRRALWPLALLLLASTLGDRAVYAYSNAIGKSEALTLTQGVPYYVGTTARTFFNKIGVKVAAKEKGIKVGGQIHFPARPLAFTKPVQPYNIVWLVSESWRADTLNGEIMPATWTFAQQAQNFRLHYSGGNGTRVGIFTMLTGIPGTYWASFLEDRRAAPLIDVLQQQDYQMSFYSSAKFSYPEFDQTVFSNVPKAQLHEIEGNVAGWQKDRQNVTDMLAFIDQRDVSRPFFTWMFFESPHARYYFPPESVIRRPYRDDINYASLDKDNLRESIEPIKNRYLNSVHHLDSQFARVFDYLKSHDLLDNTIVILTGDHGEEFMENGYWGHNSTFSDPQTRTPLVLWIPGREPSPHDKLTSHVDIPATLMPLLGVSNPASDYSTGIDLLTDQQRDYVVLADWSHVGYRDDTLKVTLPMNAQGALGRSIVAANDAKLSRDQEQQLFQSAQPNLLRVMQELGRFNRKSGG